MSAGDRTRSAETLSLYRRFRQSEQQGRSLELALGAPGASRADYLRLSSFELRRHRPEVATRHLEALVHRDPGVREPRRDLARLYARGLRFERMREELEAAAKPGRGRLQ
jgi:hypothetical protein